MRLIRVGRNRFLNIDFLVDAVYEPDVSSDPEIAGSGARAWLTFAMPGVSDLGTEPYRFILEGAEAEEMGALLGMLARHAAVDMTTKQMLIDP